MNAPNFHRAAADNRAADATDKDRRRSMTPAGEHYAEDLLGKVRRLPFWGAAEQQEALDEVLDWSNGAGYGRAAFDRLITAVANEEIAEAREALNEMLKAIGQYQADARGLDRRTFDADAYNDFDCRR